MSIWTDPIVIPPFQILLTGLLFLANKIIDKKAGKNLTDFERVNYVTDKMAETTENTFLPKQFANEDNVDAHYRTTGPEIWMQLQNHCIVPDAIVAGVGTGGTIMGVGKYLKEKHPQIKLHPLEPLNSPTLTTGHRSSSRE